MDYQEVQLAGDGELIVKDPYLAYRRVDTMVMPFMIADPTVPFKPRSGWGWAPSVKIAREEVTKRFGEILDENAAGDNIFFRVYKEHK